MFKMKPIISQNLAFWWCATCLGGNQGSSIRRSYVYQAMRITGPLIHVNLFLKHCRKLPQRVITTTAARGTVPIYQVRVASGLVSEIYHEDYVAKRMELGALVGAAPSQMWSKRRKRDIIYFSEQDRQGWLWWCYRFFQGTYRRIIDILWSRGSKR